MFSGPDLDADGNSRILRNRPHHAGGIGVASVDQFAQVRGNQSRTGEVDQPKDLGVDPVDHVATKTGKVAAPRTSGIEHGGHAPGGTQRIGLESQRHVMRIDMHVQVDQPGHDQQATGIDGESRLGRVQRFLDRQNPPAGDRHVTDPPHTL